MRVFLLIMGMLFAFLSEARAQNPSVMTMDGWKWIGTEQNMNKDVYDHSFYLYSDTIISGRNGVRVFRK